MDEAYFKRKWGDSLRRKGELFPQRFPGIQQWLRRSRLREVTEKLVLAHTSSIEDTLYADEVDYTTQAL